MQREELKAILEKIRSGIYTAEEETVARYWLHQLNHKESAGYNESQLDQVSDDMWLNIMAANAEPVTKVKKLWPGLAVAASIVMAIATGIWFYQSSIVPDNKDIIAAQNISPGANKATLTLANGKTINLSDAKSGVVIDAEKLAYNDGTLIPNDSNGDDVVGAEQIQLTTPRGGTYQVQLPDGTKVWLNAASSLSYGTILRNGNQVRKVKLNGEAYFEVAKVLNKDKGTRMPFIVESKNQQVEVLGTHFNVNSYADEWEIKTTLFEGSVKVRALPPALMANPLDKKWKNAVKVETILKPGEQAVLKSIANLSTSTVDVEQVLAWKNGVFVFKDENLGSIMRKISRWYDVEISYSNDAPMDATFGGYVSRSRTLFTVLERMEKTGQVKFKISGRKITVLNSKENE